MNRKFADLIKKSQTSGRVNNHPFASIGVEELVPPWLATRFHGIITNVLTESEVTSLCIKWIHCHVHDAGNAEDSW